MNVRKTIFYSAVKSVYIAAVHAVCDHRRRPYIEPLREMLVGLSDDMGRGNNQTLNNLTLISSNCFAGRIMQDLKMQYNSPTLGLYFMYPDYMEFLENLEYYLTEAKIEFAKESKYAIGNERRARWSHWYPIGLLDGKVEIHFLHYHTEEEAAEKWYRRAKRVNLSNLLVIGMDQNLCSEDDVRRFDKLPFRHKIMFSRYDLGLASNEYMPEFSGADSVGDPYRKGEVFYKHLIEHFSVGERDQIV